MSTKAPLKNAGPDEFISIKALTKVLIRHYGFTEVHYDLLIQFQVGMGSVGPSEEKLLPGAMIGVGGFGLKEANEIGRNTVDAAEVNPPAKAQKK